MFMLRKWKEQALCRLQRLYAGLQGRWGRVVKYFFPPGKDARESDKPGQDQKGSLFRAWSREFGVIFPRGYLPLAGAYIFALVLLFGIFISRQGKLPFLELPGNVEKRVESEMPREEAERDQNGAGVGAGSGAGAGAGAGMSVNVEMGANTDKGLATAGGTAGEATPAETDTGAGSPTDTGMPTESMPVGSGTTAGETPVESPALGNTAESSTSQIPPPAEAALPLPVWEVCCPYGACTIEKLPSGGRLHTFTRGINLTATPGAPVAALWDGRVSKTGGGDTPYSQFVILEHSGGYATFYGNLREVWVKEGARIYRGEHIGLLPHFPPVERQGTAATQAVSSAGPALQAETETAATSGKLTLKTIYKGSPGETNTSAWPFEAGKPLLYLEIRQGNSYLDPLPFLVSRN